MENVLETIELEIDISVVSVGLGLGFQLVSLKSGSISGWSEFSKWV